MALVYRDRVKQKGSVTGTSAVVLGNSVQTYVTFNNANLAGHTFPYTIVTATQFESGIGVFINPADSGTANGTVSRISVFSNSSGTTSLLNFSNNTQCDIIISNPASLSVLTSTSPSTGFKLIKYANNQYDLIDPVDNAVSLGTSINSSVLYYNSATGSFQADADLKFNPNTSEFTLNGILQATAKSFKIPHPEYLDKYLHHGSLEGPEFGIYQRGNIKLFYESKIYLPNYFQKLTGDSDEYTVLFSTNSFIPVKCKKDKKYIQFKSLIPVIKPIEVSYLVIASRTDVNFKIQSDVF